MSMNITIVIKARPFIISHRYCNRNDLYSMVCVRSNTYRKKFRIKLELIVNRLTMFMIWLTLLTILLSSIQTIWEFDE